MTENDLPRGIRNNNPGNIRWGDPWQGLVEPSLRTDPAFCQFVNPAYGIRAIVRILVTYQDQHKVRTPTDIITRWAPPAENDTAAYIRAVCLRAGLRGDEQLDAHEFASIEPLVLAIIWQENGMQPYDDTIVVKGFVLAGVEPPAVPVAESNTFKQTRNAALGLAGIGATAVASYAPDIINAVLDSGPVAHKAREQLEALISPWAIPYAVAAYVIIRAIIAVRKSRRIAAETLLRPVA